jgi:hypothetical protein
MKGQTVDKVIELIGDHKDEHDLELISKACWARSRQLRDRQGAKVRRQVKEGDVVEVIGKIKPKYLRGAEGPVMKTDATHCHIKIPEFGYRRYGGAVVGIPWTCIQKVRG